ncbi:MAG: thiamine-phosphate diphosphorylase [Legionellales bacterium RIFCSPHIGHO2_12_FULL_37_14]|nr:MAG: thiamine-phosphate diphosphorylase [Legionellales bacterium RIFCSPHIGHO2_12_FULL_37_14]
MKLSCLKLCLLTFAKDIAFAKYVSFLDLAIEGGVTSIQFRDKWLTPAKRFQFAKQLRDYTARRNIPLIINDDVELTKSIEADGVHLGQSDFSAPKARESLAPGTFIGLSIESLPELQEANKLTCLNYVAASAVFPSNSKKNCKNYWGVNGLKGFIQLSKHPVVAIGGIKLTHIQPIIKLGASGIAVINAIHSAKDPKNMAAQIINEINLGSA